jgi:hypothetical protein
MDKCNECSYGIAHPLEDKQIRRVRRSIPNWDCDHPSAEVRKQSLQVGFSQNCPHFKKK